MDARNFFAPANELSRSTSAISSGFSGRADSPEPHVLLRAITKADACGEGITQVTNVPTLAERAGDFSRQPAGDRSVHAAAVSGQQDSRRRSRIRWVWRSRRFIRAQSRGSRARTSSRRRPSATATTISMRGWTTPWRERSDLVVRYSFADRSLYEPFTGSGFAAIPGLWRQRAAARAERHVERNARLLAANLLNEFRLGSTASRPASFSRTRATVINRAVGLPEVSNNPRDFGLSLISVTGYSPLGDEYNNPQHSASNIFQFIDHGDLRPRPAPAQVRRRHPRPAPERVPRRTGARVRRLPRPDHGQRAGRTAAGSCHGFGRRASR